MWRSPRVASSKLSRCFHDPALCGGPGPPPSGPASPRPALGASGGLWSPRTLAPHRPQKESLWRHLLAGPASPAGRRGSWHEVGGSQRWGVRSVSSSRVTPGRRTGARRPRVPHRKSHRRKEGDPPLQGSPGRAEGPGARGGPGAKAGPPARRGQCPGPLTLPTPPKPILTPRPRDDVAFAGSVRSGARSRCVPAGGERPERRGPAGSRMGGEAGTGSPGAAHACQSR